MRGRLPNVSSTELVHRTARVTLRVTKGQQRRCYGLLRSGGDVWAWALDTNRSRRDARLPGIVSYKELCRELARHHTGFGELGTVGARSVLRRYSVAWYLANERRKANERAGYPRRKRAFVPIRYYHGTFELDGKRVRLPMARGSPTLWLRLAQPVPYSAEQVRSITLLVEGRRLALDVTAAIPVEQHDLDSNRIAGVDLGIIHPIAIASDDAGLLLSGRALRAEGRLHLADQKARERQLARRRAPSRQKRQAGSRRWKRLRQRQRQAEVRHRRRVRLGHHEAAKAAVAFAVEHRIGTLRVGDLRGISRVKSGPRHNRRVQDWQPGHLLRTLRDKAQRAGITVEVVSERGSSSTCPECNRRVQKPPGRNFSCPQCGFIGHRDLVGARNIAAAGGGITSTLVLVMHRRVGQVPARRDRRRHLYDQHRRRRSCSASSHPKRQATGVSLDQGVEAGRHMPRPARHRSDSGHVEDQ
jgi:IS605 OrfB family transposase